MSTDEEMFNYYLIGLRSGSWDAIHSLMEMGPAVLPLVEAAYAAEQDPGVRADLVNIAWEQRCADALPILEIAMNDSDPRVWKQALDGLVTLGSPDARRVVVSASKIRPDRDTHGQFTFQEWIADAIEQIDNAGNRTES